MYGIEVFLWYVQRGFLSYAVKPRPDTSLNTVIAVLAQVLKISKQVSEACSQKSWS